jgi:hypothetical protein
MLGLRNVASVEAHAPEQAEDSRLPEGITDLGSESECRLQRLFGTAEPKKEELYRAVLLQHARQEGLVGCA